MRSTKHGSEKDRSEGACAFWLATWLLVMAMACSPGSSGDSGSGGRGGSQTGGATATGGTTTSGSGGTVATGGSRGGGTTGSGGSGATGGTAATGGTSTGGSGGGGTSGTGGSVATGGARATGGIQSTGGTNATGGRAGADGGAGTGGSTATGGRAGAGGTAATGGTAGNATGGIQGTGGARPDGSPDLTADATPDTTRDATGDAGAAYAPCPTTPGTACAILPLGDSITEGCCTAPMGGYRIELFRQAMKDGKNITFVGSLTNGPATVDNQPFPQHHEGHGGYTIDSGTGHSGISGQITQNALANYKPHIVLLMIGTNDINGNIDTANAPTRLANLIDDITTRAPSTLLVVASIIPSKNDGTNTNFQKYNAAIPGLVDARAKAGKHVVFLDNYKDFSANASYKTALLADNLHPNSAGYAVLAQSFYGVIGTLLPAAP